MRRGQVSRLHKTLVACLYLLLRHAHAGGGLRLLVQTDMYGYHSEKVREEVAREQAKAHPRGYAAEQEKRAEEMAGQRTLSDAAA